MKNTVGAIASQEDFYYRKKEIERIHKALDAKANIQLAAPRRVGKSSILYYLMDNPEQGYVHLYVDVESARTKDDFFRKIYREILKSDFVSKSKGILAQITGKNGVLGRLKGIKIAGVGFDFNEADELNYEDELTNLLLGLDLEGHKLVLMIDEFPEVLLNMVEDANGDTVEAKRFLQSNRELRSNKALHGKVQFIYTGSNSLNLTAESLGASVLINDLNAVSVYPLSPSESKELTVSVLKTYGYTIGDSQLEHLLTVVEWNIPFYFQLMIQEIINQIEPQEQITNDVINTGFNNIMEQRNNHHFEHYVTRLKRIFTENEKKYVQKFLNTLAQAPALTKGEAQNMAHGILSESETRRVLNALVYDGYIVSDQQNEFKFNSPILKQWWFSHEC
jgi:AAA+ ATPase superfamily predicted ATPase